MLEIRLLGKFEVTRDGKPIAIPSRPAQTLFAYLVLTVGTAHRREKLAGMLWPDSTEESARDYLRHSLWKIRKVIEPVTSKSKPGPCIITDDIHISFNSDSKFSLDVKTIKDVNENTSTKELMNALSLYEGELLPGFYDDWVLLEREHLQAVFESKMARLLSLLQAEGRWLDVLKWGERWISFGQKPEPAYRALMSAHAAKGDMSKVAATYERCVKSLKEFGVEPSEQTVILYEQLKAGQGVASGSGPLGEQALVKKEANVRSSNLPVPLTSFIGREKEAAEIVRLLGKNRLVTLMGSGGVGKTRLAIESANKILPKFKDGVWWVDLVGLADPLLVPQEVARVLDAREIPNQPMMETLVKHLGSKQLLLVLDNCEHLISACAQLADRLLSGCKNLKMLATSREALDILGETTFHVPSLSLPGTQEYLAVKALSKFESVRLFGERAKLIQPAFELSDQNAQAVVQICRRLSGMPLAIELAAARVKMMSVDEISKRLDDRFDLLTSGNRGALPRHQTLRATIDWSYDLLTESERIFFRSLAVFAGGLTLEAAEAVCGHGELKQNNVLDLLGRLVDKSLVIAEQVSITEGTRYRLLETIREYAHEKLGEVEGTELRNQHLDFFVKLVEEAEPQLEMADQGTWLDRLETEFDNIRAALEWALASAQTVLALRIVGGLRRFWLIRNHDYEAFERMKSILNRPDTTQPTSARLKAMNAYFFMLWPQGTMMEAKPLIEEALALGKELEDHWNTAFTLLWAGMTAAEEGDYVRAGSYLQQSHDKWREYGDPTYMAMSLVFLGEIAVFQNEYGRAQTLLEQAAPRFREVQDYPFLGMILRRLGQLAVYRNEPIKATTLIRESLIHNWNVHDYRGAGACLAALANISRVRGQTERAVKLFGAVSHVLEFTRIPLLPFDQQEYERNSNQLRSTVEDKIFMKSLAKGKAMSLDEAIAFALEKQ